MHADIGRLECNRRFRIFADFTVDRPLNPKGILTWLAEMVKPGREVLHVIGQVQNIGDINWKIA
jgi:hypothetical protein